MKKSHHLTLVAVVSIAALMLPMLATAQDSGNEGDAPDNSSTSSERRPIPLPLPAGIKQKLENAYENRLQNAENNRDLRNSVMEDRNGQNGWAYGSSTVPFSGARERGSEGMMYGSTTAGWLGQEQENESGRYQMPFLPPMMRRFASSTEFASSTFMDKMMRDREDNRGKEDMRLDMFAWVQNRLVDQLNRALDNLKQIRGRIADRIQKETSAGRDMTAASDLLAVADNDITAAGQAVQTLASYTPTAASSTDSTASTTVSVLGARQLGSNAIQAVKTARKALNDVVTAIAQAMGLELGQQNEGQSSSTPPVATSSPSTATSTGGTASSTSE